MSKSIFTRIMEGEIPSYPVYENAFVYAFLDIHPASLGHVLVVPRTQVDAFDSLSEPFYSEIFRAAGLIARAQKLAFHVPRVSLQIHGFEVPHAHIHLIPAHTMEDTAIKSGAPTPSTEELKSTQNSIVIAISSLA